MSTAGVALRLAAEGAAAGGGHQLLAYDAEYVALTQLQGDALVTLDERLAREMRDLVPVAAVDALGRSRSPRR